jgi:hypothetical protein
MRNSFLGIDIRAPQFQPKHFGRHAEEYTMSTSADGVDHYLEKVLQILSSHTARAEVNRRRTRIEKTDKRVRWHPV